MLTGTRSPSSGAHSRDPLALPPYVFSLVMAGSAIHVFASNDDHPFDD
jgi:hypothetical protein